MLLALVSVQPDPLSVPSAADPMPSCTNDALITNSTTLNAIQPITAHTIHFRTRPGVIGPRGNRRRQPRRLVPAWADIAASAVASSRRLNRRGRAR